MTGYYIRAQRDGSWQTLEIDELSDAELEAFIRSQRENGPEKGWEWVRALAVWIRDNVRTGAGEVEDRNLREER